MPYTISGTVNQPCRILVVNENNWSTIEYTTIVSGTNSYTITGLLSGNKTIIGINLSNNETISYSAVIPAVYGGVGDDRGVFGGGTNAIDFIQISVIGQAQSFGLLTSTKGSLSATSNSVNDRGIFGGGGTGINVIDKITISTAGNATDFGGILTASRYDITATSNGVNNRGVFMGGESPSVATMDYVIINTPSNAISFGSLISARCRSAATSNGINNRGVIGGGYSVANGFYSAIEYITIPSVSNSISFGALTITKDYLASTSNSTNNRGIFGGGTNSSSVTINAIDYITITTLGAAASFGILTAVRSQLAATSNGTNNRGVFGGGAGSSNIIDYVTISTTGAATDFGDLTVGRNALAATSNC